MMKSWRPQNYGRFDQVLWKSMQLPIGHMSYLFPLFSFCHSSCNGQKVWQKRKLLQFLWPLVHKSIQRKYSFKRSLLLNFIKRLWKKHNVPNYNKVNYIIIPCFMYVITLLEILNCILYYINKSNLKLLGAHV